MALQDYCPHCRAPLSADETPDRLCEGFCYLADDYRRYDDLREEGYMSYQAKLMCGLADPPDPDHE